MMHKPNFLVILPKIFEISSNKIGDMIKIVFVALALVMSVVTTSAQENNADKYAAVALPHKVENLTLQDAKAKPVTLPMWGEKNLLIFYVDPDRHRQNHDFVADMEEQQFAAGDNIYGFGVINLKDTWLPNSVIVSLAAKRTEKNGATIIADTNRKMAEEWGLGDCNNKFIIMIVSKEGELVFCRKGEFSEQDKKEFIEIVQQYR